MRSHITIAYPKGIEQVADWLRQRAADDPLTAVGDGQWGEFYVVLAASEDQAKWAQEQIDADRLLAVGVCLIEVSPKFNTMRVNLECGEEECAVTARLIKDLLARFPDYAVYDEDTDENITELVRADVDALFKQ